MLRKIKDWLIYSQDILAINIIISLKVIAFSYMYISVNNLILLSLTTMAVIFICTAWIMLLPFLLRQSFLLMTDVAVTLLIVADSMFMRFFNRAIPVLAFYQYEQLNLISSSIINLFSFNDFLFTIDLVLIVPFLASSHIKQQKKKSTFKYKFAQMVLIFFICSIMLLCSFTYFINTNSLEVVTNINNDNTLLNNMGILNYHFADLYNTLNNSKSNTLLTQNEILEIQSWNVYNQSYENNHYGVALGKNLIIIQIESLQNFLINKSVNGQEVTPNLNKLITSSIYFDDYFVQVGQGNSSDAEFMTFNSIYPPSVGSSMLLYAQNDYISLPKLLKERGYNSFVIHGDVPDFWGRDVAYPSMGIDKYFSINELENGQIIGMGLSDEDVFNQSVSILEKAEKPFIAMIITLSSHHPYIVPESEKALNIPAVNYSPLFVDYLQSQHYVDKQLGIFIDTLRKDGILDNSLLVVYGDHFGMGWKDSDIEEFLSLNEPLNEYNNMELKKVPLIIRLPFSQQIGILHQTGGQMDLMPTIANLMGVERNKMFCFGKDLLNQKDGITLFRYYASDGSFANDTYMYIGSSDGIFEHGHGYNRKNNQEIDLEVIRNMYKQAKRQLRLSDLILKGNALPDILQNEE